MDCFWSVRPTPHRYGKQKGRVRNTSGHSAGLLQVFLTRQSKRYQRIDRFWPRKKKKSLTSGIFRHRLGRDRRHNSSSARHRITTLKLAINHTGCGQAGSLTYTLGQPINLRRQPRNLGYYIRPIGWRDPIQARSR